LLYIGIIINKKREDRKMKQELIFLEQPACGKGTQTNRLSEYLGFPHIDTGSLLRAEIAKATPDGLVAKSYIDKGQLVPPELVGTIIGNRLAEEDCSKGYVLDGYPRSLAQAEVLEKINSNIDKENADFKAIYFDIDTELLIERIVNRQSCPKCGEIYNKKFKPTKAENICDNCKVELKTRADDNEEIARARFETYYRETSPLIEFYENKGVLHKLDANGSIDMVWERLLNIINK
jgi:adenylate kinase